MDFILRRLSSPAKVQQGTAELHNETKAFADDDAIAKMWTADSFKIREIM
jgi:hypothetical protein